MELTITLLNFGTSCLAFFVALIGLRALVKWRGRWEAESNRMAYLYKVTFSDHTMAEFLKEIELARSKADGDFARFRSSLRARIDYRKEL